MNLFFPSQDQSMRMPDYLNRMSEKPDWKPGWEAIEETFRVAYGTSGQYVQSSSSVLDGFGVYPMPQQGHHIVTRGLSCIDPSPDAFRQQRSGWGFELTVRWPDGADVAFAFRLLERLAMKTEQQKAELQQMRLIRCDLQQLCEPALTALAPGLFLIKDRTIPQIETLHGSVAFLQLVNISEEDRATLRRTPSLINNLLTRAEMENPDMVFRLPPLVNYLS